METFLATKQWILDNYDKYNKLYWNGTLPRIEAKISRSKKTFGYASWNWDGTKMFDFKIAISNYYELTEKSRLNTLLHEMIHIADFSQHPEHFDRKRRTRYDAHGEEFFLKEAARLNKDGWNIKKYKTEEEMVGSKLSEKVQQRLEKPYILVVFRDKKSTYRTYVQKIQNAQISYMKNLLEDFNFEIEGFYKTNYEKYRERRCSKRTYYTVGSDFVRTLENDENVIFKKLDV